MTYEKRVHPQRGVDRQLRVGLPGVGDRHVEELRLDRVVGGDAAVVDGVVLARRATAGIAVLGPHGRRDGAARGERSGRANAGEPVLSGVAASDLRRRGSGRRSGTAFERPARERIAAGGRVGRAQQVRHGLLRERGRGQVVVAVGVGGRVADVEVEQVLGRELVARGEHDAARVGADRVVLRERAGVVLEQADDAVVDAVGVQRVAVQPHVALVRDVVLVLRLDDRELVGLAVLAVEVDRGAHRPAAGRVREGVVLGGVHVAGGERAAERAGIDVLVGVERRDAGRARDGRVARGRAAAVGNRAEIRRAVDDVAEVAGPIRSCCRWDSYGCCRSRRAAERRRGSRPSCAGSRCGSWRPSRDR